MSIFLQKWSKAYIPISTKPHVNLLQNGLNSGIAIFHRLRPTQNLLSQIGKRLRAITGAVEQRTSPVQMEYLSGPGKPALIAETETYHVYAVRWNVFANVHGEGLLLQPKTPAVAAVVAIPDADQTPEMLAGLEKGIATESQFARRLVEAGCEVIVPVLINRQSTHSGNPAVKMTNATHREWIWRQSYDMGRHIIGYEIQKIEAAVDWLKSQHAGKKLKVGVAGYGEGGLLALYAAALNEQIDVAMVSGYFDSRQQMWQGPIYRSLFGFLKEFGDAEVASLIAPRTLIVEPSQGPNIPDPPPLQPGVIQTAAPGRIVSPNRNGALAELSRAIKLCTSPAGKFMGTF